MNTQNASVGSTGDHQIAFQYAWSYFALHAGQRMQAVNFFLVATAFIAAAFVDAMVGAKPALAAGLGLVGSVTSFIFLRIEQRVRALLHAAEDALLPIERAMAENSGNLNLRILEKVAVPRSGAWAYSTVFRALYTLIGIAFFVAAAHALQISAAEPAQAMQLHSFSSPLALGMLFTFCYGTAQLASVLQRSATGGVGKATAVATIVLCLVSGVAAILLALRMADCL